MSLTNPNKIVTEERLAEYHQAILPYLGGNSMVACGGGYAPIGTIIAFMGTTAPSDFLACDGSVLNIADYSELADFFELQFGSTNYFGGDGETTFAVPDLRGEFLRGTGTNSHTDQGAGSNVGEHQDATRHPYFYGNAAGNLVFVGGETTSTSGSDNGVTPANADTVKDGKNQRRITSTMNATLVTTHKFYSSRPTNTSVLYCIKAKSQGNGYSTSEQIVGTWINGKPIYQKTVIKQDSSQTYDMSSSNIDTVINISGMAFYTNDSSYNVVNWVHPNYPSQFGNMVSYFSNALQFRINGVSMDIVKWYVTIQYTKTTD